MMRIRILWVGRTRERCLEEGISRYLMLLQPLCRVSVVEIREEKGKDRERSRAAEAERIVKQTASYILLDERGKEFSSPGFARFIQERWQETLQEKGAVDFVIGGPFGVADEIREKATAVIALSRMTFTHEMVRLILLEQLYRAMTILKGKEYHH
ncbi:MAG: 23S rRNA (pseudouridine(1915)-N(3))-methyltransferase RlmH [Nitrospirota bacterium]